MSSLLHPMLSGGISSLAAQRPNLIHDMQWTNQIRASLPMLYDQSHQPTMVPSNSHQTSSPSSAWISRFQDSFSRASRPWPSCTSSTSTRDKISSNNVKKSSTRNDTCQYCGKVILLNLINYFY